MTKEARISKSQKEVASPPVQGLFGHSSFVIGISFIIRDSSFGFVWSFGTGHSSSLSSTLLLFLALLLASSTHASTNSDVFLVRDFGAVGDGKADDTPAFQRRSMPRTRQAVAWCTPAVAITFLPGT